MTTVRERTHSVVQTAQFLQELARDLTQPEAIRLKAQGLLRHYPTKEDIWFSGKLEKLRKDELYILEENHGILPPALSTWLLVEPMFCEDRVQDVKNGNS